MIAKVATCYSLFSVVLKYNLAIDLQLFTTFIFFVIKT